MMLTKSIEYTSEYMKWYTKSAKFNNGENILVQGRGTHSQIGYWLGWLKTVEV